MKRNLKKSMALLCVTAMALSFIPAFAFADMGERMWGSSAFDSREVYSSAGNSFPGPSRDTTAHIEHISGNYGMPESGYESTGRQESSRNYEERMWGIPADTYASYGVSAESNRRYAEENPEIGAFQDLLKTGNLGEKSEKTKEDQKKNETGEGSEKAGKEESESSTLEIQVGDQVIAVTGNLPDGAEIQAVEIPSDAAAELVGKDPLFAPGFAYDIRLVIDGEIWQPEEHGEEVKVSFRDTNGKDLPKNGDTPVLHIKTDLMDKNGRLSEEALKSAVDDVSKGRMEIEYLKARPTAGSFSFHTGGFSAFVENVKTKIETFFGLKVEYDEEKVEVKEDKDKHEITLTSKNPAGGESGVVVTNDDVTPATGSILVASTNIVLKLKNLVTQALNNDTAVRFAQPTAEQMAKGERNSYKMIVEGSVDLSSSKTAIEVNAGVNLDISGTTANKDTLTATGTGENGAGIGSDGNKDAGNVSIHDIDAINISIHDIDVEVATVEGGFKSKISNTKGILQYSETEDKLNITGNGTAEIGMASEGDVSGKSIIFGYDADKNEQKTEMTVTLKDINISAEKAIAGILVGAKANLTMNLSGTNTVTGGKNHAGVEVEWKNGKEYASLTIGGDGTLNATGGSGDGGAGIGGSKTKNTVDGYGNENGVYGDITINGGTINATGTGSSAGIGSSNNPLAGTSHGSFKYTEEPWGKIVINDGNIKAVGNENGAGIGGGNHTCSGEIIINGGTIDARGDSGIGSGLGSHNGADKGPGYFYADVTINGGKVTAYATNNMGAGIGGGMYGDAYVKITGGDITASVSTDGNPYQGGAGIGGGYQGVAQVEITGGTVNATGGNGAPGIGNGALGADTTTSSLDADGNPTGTKYVRTGKPTIATRDSGVVISGGTVTAKGGVHAAGIGSGNASEWSSVTITGGTVTAIGGLSTKEEMAGGAGIGSGTMSSPDKPGYSKETEVHVTITGGDVTATGGWGAAGIGSGANNTTAKTITIGADAQVEAYSDGTKFAIDSRDGKADIDVAGDILQATFVFEYKEEDGTPQDPTGLKSIIVTNEKTGKKIELTGMLEGYRSFATTVEEPGSYTVYSEDEDVSMGSGRYFGESDLEQRGEGHYDMSRLVQYKVSHGNLSDNYFLFPVKSVVVTKVVVADEGLDPSDINTTCYFALWDRSKNEYVLKDGKIWIESVDIVNGVPQGKAIFGDVNDSPSGGYGVWEIDKEDPYNGNVIGMGFGSYELRLVKTTHGNTDENDAIIDKDTWTDYISIINTYVPIPEPEPEPKPEPEPEPEPEPTPPTPPAPVDPDIPFIPVQPVQDGFLEIEDFMTPLAGGINMNEGDCFN